MITVSAHHKVQDYAAWRKVFDEGSAVRTRFGCTGHRVFQSLSDPNELTVLTEWKSVDHAKTYAASDEVKEGMKNAGVISQPDLMFLAEA
jgi:heme-degrading monooxygenase HmoA